MPEKAAKAASKARTAIALALILCLSACGFRLAGTAELPPRLATMRLETTNFQETQRKALSRSLKAAGANLVEQSDSQAVRLGVTLEVVPDRELAISGSSGTIVKRITRGLTWTLKEADGKIISPAQTLRLQKDLSLSDDALLASDQERESAVRALEESLYQQLIRQLTRI